MAIKLFLSFSNLMQRIGFCTCPEAANFSIQEINELPDLSVLCKLEDHCRIVFLKELIEC